jgi:gas vesicle protein
LKPPEATVETLQAFSQEVCMTYNNDDLERENENWSFMTGLLVGTAIGATAALLMAPKRGSEFRTDLASAATNVRDTVSNKVSNLKKTADEMAERGRQMAGDASRTIQQTAQSVADTGSAMYDSARRAGGRTTPTGSLE